MQTAAAAAKVVAAGVVAAGRGTRPCVALRARVLFQELGIAMVAWHHSASAVRYPRSPPRIGLHNGAAHGDHGGVG